MDRMLYWLVRWPWTIGVVVFFALTQVPLGPWYISAMFIIGVALITTGLMRRLKWKLIEIETLRRQDRLPVPLLAPREATYRL